jgi:DNA-binding NarL/FixJ family response regulator
MIKVLLVDDQELVRAGLRAILRSPFGFEIVGDCADGTVVTGMVDALAPDAVLMGCADAAGRRHRRTRRLRAHADAPPVLALTIFDDEEVLADMLRAEPPASCSRAYPPKTC